MSLVSTRVLARLQQRWRWVTVAVVVAVVATVAVVWQSDLPIDAWLLALREWVEPQGVLGAVFLTVVVALWGMVLPPAPLQFLMAVIYGVVGGIVLFYVASTVTLILMVVTVRMFGRGLVERRLEAWPKLRVIERALVHHGWRSVMLLRLSGAIPSTVANPLLAASRVPVFTIIWASWVGKFPGILLMGLLGGASAQWAAREQGSSTGTWILLAIAVIASLALIILISRTARRLWREELAAEQAEQSADSAAGE